MTSWVPVSWGSPGAATHESADAEVTSLLVCKLKPAPAVVPAPPSTVPVPVDAPAAAADPLEVLAARVAGTLGKAELEALVESFESAGQLPRDIDRQLLAGGRFAIGRDLEPKEKKRVRGGFVELCRRRLAE